MPAPSLRSFWSVALVTLIAACAAVPLGAPPALAQTTAPASAARTAGDTLPSPEPAPLTISNRSLTWLGLGTMAATGALFPFDVRIAHRMQLARGRGTGAGEDVADALNLLGEPGGLIAPVVLVGAGWVGHSPTLVDVGMHTGEGIVLGGSITAVLKRVIGRTRPALGSIDADHVTFGAGFSQEAATSFPSGHTTTVFALATALTTETARLHPDATWLVATSSFTFATGVAVARLYTDQHWASDVVLGAGVGTISALLVERFAHGTARTRGIPAWLLPKGVASSPTRGSMVVWSAPTPW